jgi:hypothetical protein
MRVLSRETLKRWWRTFSESTVRMILVLVVALGLSIAFLEIAVLTFFKFQPVRDEPSEQIKAAASQLKTQEGWKMISEEASTQGGVCFIGNCSYLQQVWDIGKKSMDCPTLQQLLTDSGYSISIRKASPESCTPSVGALSSEAAAAGGELAVKVSVTEVGNTIGLGDEGSGAKLIFYIAQRAQ